MGGGFEVTGDFAVTGVTRFRSDELSARNAGRRDDGTSCGTGKQYYG